MTFNLALSTGLHKQTVATTTQAKRKISLTRGQLSVTKTFDNIMLRYYSHHFPSRRRSLLSIIPHSSRRGGRIRFPPRSSFTTKPPPARPSIPNKENPRVLTRLNRRLPKFLHPYTNRLISAPLSHITSFLILHELSALVPLVALFGLFHYTSWLPGGFGQAVWAREKAEKLVRYLERKAYWKRRLQRKNKNKEEEEKEGEEGGSEGNLSSSGRMGERISRVLLEYVSIYKSSSFFSCFFECYIISPLLPPIPLSSIPPVFTHQQQRKIFSLSPPDPFSQNTPGLIQYT